MLKINYTRVLRESIKDDLDFKLYLPENSLYLINGIEMKQKTLYGHIFWNLRVTILLFLEHWHKEEA